jgi:formamidase
MKGERGCISSQDSTLPTPESHPQYLGRALLRVAPIDLSRHPARRCDHAPREDKMFVGDPAKVQGGDLAMKRVQIDRQKHLCDEPGTGHNRWHPDIAPLAEVDEGEEIALETRDGGDAYLTPESTIADVAQFPLTAIHPLTGPVSVKGARPGDLLEIEFRDISPEPWGYTLIMPGGGYLPDLINTTYLAQWHCVDGWATSAQIPGVRIPGAPFMGISGVAPSRRQLEEWAKREADLVARGGFAFLPDTNMAVPAVAAEHGLRTVPPRENGGNLDVKQLTAGAKLFLPVAVDGAMFSTGDGHFAQGDGEVCLTAIEMGATCTVRFKIHRGEAERRNITWPRYERATPYADPKWGMPERFVATMGMPIDDQGVNHGADLNLATRNALINMLELLQERGYSREQAYVICSVAVDLRIGSAVNVPNYVVSAVLPEQVFVG